MSHSGLQRERRAEWDEFYAQLHEAPVAHTYRDMYAPHVEVTEGLGRWRGVEDWSAHEREAIEIGVRATVIGLVASRDLTVLDIDFTNPAWADDYCPLAARSSTTSPEAAPTGSTSNTSDQQEFTHPPRVYFGRSQD